MMGPIFWMLLGALLAAVLSSLYHNKNFSKAMQEERAKWGAEIQEARSRVKSKL